MTLSHCLILLLACAACGDARDVPEGLAGSEADETAPPEAPPDASPTLCAEGAERDCKITLPTVEGVSNCFVGIQICTGGEWGDCQSDDD